MADVRYYSEPHRTTFVRTLDLLVLRRSEGDVFFVVEGLRIEDEKLGEGKSYFYEEHSCPTNHVRCEAIITDGDDDPHGIFEFVRSVDMPEGYDEESVDWLALFPEAFVRRE